MLSELWGLESTTYTVFTYDKKVNYFPCYVMAPVRKSIDTFYLYCNL